MAHIFPYSHTDRQTNKTEKVLMESFLLNGKATPLGPVTVAITVWKQTLGGHGCTQSQHQGSQYSMESKWKSTHQGLSKTFLGWSPYPRKPLSPGLMKTISGLRGFLASWRRDKFKSSILGEVQRNQNHECLLQSSKGLALIYPRL